jgi:hypothetical protein
VTIPVKAQTVSKAHQSLQRLQEIERILVVEARAREVATLAELQYLIANEPLSIAGCDQIIVHVGPSPASLKVACISSIVEVDHQAPLVRWLSQSIKESIDDGETNAPSPFTLDEYSNETPYPFHHGILFPVKDHEGNWLGAVSFLSAQPLDKRSIQVAGQLTHTFSHSWGSFQKRSGLWSKLFKKRNWILTMGAVALLGAIPVPLTVIAPAEIIPRDPVIVAAPADGVIEKVNGLSNQVIEKGTLLFSYNTVMLRNELEVSRRELQVAESRYLRSSQSAFSQSEGRRELAITKGEFEIARAKRDYALAQLARAEVFASHSGILLFSGAQEWEGRPVSTGERIMQIADPDKTEIMISLPAANSAILLDKPTARIFLDSDPLNPVTASITDTSYQAKQGKDGVLAFKIKAMADEDLATIRMGVRGTAQLMGNTVPLAYNLFRKPIAAIRQYIGV